MKHDRLNKRVWSHKRQTQPNKTWPVISVMVVFFAAVFFVPASFAKEVVPEKQKGQVKKEQIELNSTTVAPQTNQPAAQLEPVEPQRDQMQPASGVTDKGKQIKWQTVSSGSDCGTGGVTYRLGARDGCELCGTVGQLAVGSGSSPSYGINSGYWQEDLQPYTRGDVNKDGIIDVADVMCLINYLFIDGSAPDPLWLGDVTCDDAVDVADVMYLINYLFIGGSPPGC